MKKEREVTNSHNIFVITYMSSVCTHVEYTQALHINTARKYGEWEALRMGAKVISVEKGLLPKTLKNDENFKILIDENY